MDQSELLRRIVLAFEGADVEYLLKKLEYYRDGGTEKHLRDISGILRVSGDGLDLEYIKRWADAKDLSDVWLAVLSRSKPQ